MDMPFRPPTLWEQIKYSSPAWVPDYEATPKPRVIQSTMGRDGRPNLYGPQPGDWVAPKATRVEAVHPQGKTKKALMIRGVSRAIDDADGGAPSQEQFDDAVAFFKKNEGVAQ